LSIDSPYNKGDSEPNKTGTNHSGAKVNNFFEDDSNNLDSEFEAALSPSASQTAAELKRQERLNQICQVNEIVFSSNERFALLITAYQASLIEIMHNKTSLIEKIELTIAWNEENKNAYQIKWIGAVNNSGTVVALHCPNEFICKGMKHTVGRTDSTPMLENDKMMHSNPVWIWRAKETLDGTSTFKKLDFGHVLRDEIMDISFEPEDP
jgi:hypothetical protein